MKILLPIYDYDDAKLIIDFVSNFNWPPHACFKLLHVITSQVGEEEEAKAEKLASIRLADIMYRLKSVLPSAVADSELMAGTPVLEIVNFASQWQADMIVMGSRTRVGIDACLTGSVSKGVVMQAPCSVVTIKPPVRHEGHPFKQVRGGDGQGAVGAVHPLPESKEVHLLTG
ncbi:MAG: universal stress protein [Cyanobacteria bacterium REEB67]|nr:universal stress protein [Cyanobacteria bacterium REEB67]